MRIKMNLKFNNLPLIILSLVSITSIQDIELALKRDKTQLTAKELYSEGKYIESRTKFYELIEINNQVSKSNLVGYSHLMFLVPWVGIARCEVKLGNNKEAIAAFRKGIAYDVNIQELYADSLVLAEYALHLANTNNLREAKITYYLAMSRLKSSTTKTEPKPFTFVFDQDPNAEVWTFSKDNLVKACEGLLVLASGDNGQQLAKKYPDWPFAQAISSMRQSKTKGERFTPENDPNIMRKNLQVLIKANEDLKTDWPKICEKYVVPIQNR